MDYFAHPQSLVEAGATIGARTRVWAFTHVLPGADIGEDCNLCDHVFVENDVIVGNRVTVKCGVQLWDGVRLEDDVFVGPNATFSNDSFPRSRIKPPEFLKTVVRAGASIGANATILPGVTIGARAMIGAGAVVTQDVPQNAIAVGNPARIVGYADSQSRPSEAATVARAQGDVLDLGAGGAKLFSLPVIPDLRGTLSAAEYGKNLPFIPKRYFIVFDVPSREARGEHAHKQLHQFLVCVKGSMNVVVDDGVKRVEVQLDAPGRGLYIPPMIWSVQHKFSSDAVLLVLASDRYDSADYIRSYDEFLSMTASSRAT